ncbi:MAG TPA: GNAT family N-acetyltransferase [Burkholderiales bacterium]|nr:GNAT family N-acetyltransferase [Burkholderiales bacterium]
MTVLTKQLSALSREALRRHFFALPADDIRLRFGSSMSGEGIDAYVDKVDFDRDAVFGVFDNDLQLIGVAHLALDPEHDAAELGVSVLLGHRGRGVGTALFERAEGHARNHYIKILFMHCLTENQPIMHIAQKSGMRVVTGAGESDAHLELTPPDAANVTDELMQERVALWDIALKAQFRSAKKIATAMAGKGADELQRAVGMQAAQKHVDAEKSKQGDE